MPCCKKPTLLEPKWEKDTVYLYQFAGTPTMPSLSPFCVKVEAYLRLHKIPFKRVYNNKARGKNGKLPMIELNGEQISDSQLIIMRLQKQLNLKDYMNDRDAALGHALDRMVDLQTSALMYPHKNMELVLKAIVPQGIAQSLLGCFMPLIKCCLARRIKKRLEASIGSFTDEEMEELLRNDFNTLKDTLGDKQFLFGDKATPADCTLFGQLSTLYYIEPGSARLPYALLASAEYKPLMDWLVRMKDTLFGDEFHM